jgi:cell division protein FtsN
MSLTKNITTAAAAVALAGVIGIAYSQTTNDPAQSPSSDTSQMTSPAATTPSPSDNTGSPAAAPSSDSTTTPDSATTGTDSGAGAMPAERAPKADRG